VHCPSVVGKLSASKCLITVASPQNYEEASTLARFGWRTRGVGVVGWGAGDGTASEAWRWTLVRPGDQIDPSNCSNAKATSKAPVCVVTVRPAG